MEIRHLACLHVPWTCCVTLLLCCALSIPLARAAPGTPTPAVLANLRDELPADFSDALDADTREQILRGRYIARLGGCVACHTHERDQPLAGGRPLETPFGKLYSTNITPDRQTGIGQYGFAQFDRVMREGVTVDGRHLYPAMPYPSYAKISDEDMRALYVYLMQAVNPVSLPNRPPALSFPFNQRRGMALWNLAFLQAAPFRPDPARSVQWNRGAYIVQGPGHCGACHTPRGVGWQEKALSETGSNGPLFLSGATLQHWRALNLRGRWRPEDVAALLRSGSNRFGAASGNMVEVVQHSTQYLSNEDLLAIGTYLASLPSPQREQAAPVLAAPATGNVPATLYSSRGGLGYVQFCVTCHRSDGNGVPQLFPPLAGNPTLQGEEPASLIHIMLTGGRAARTHARPQALSMPSFSALSDGEIAEILNFVRASWSGHQGVDISERQVARLRAQLGKDQEQAAATGFETPRLADMLKEKKAAQLIRGARLISETGRLLPQHVGNGLNCASCHLNAGTVGGGSPYVGVSADFPSYAARAGRVITLEDRINACFSRSLNGKPMPPGSQDMQAMLAYIEWMRRDAQPGEKVPGRGIGKIDQKLKPDPVNGERIYHARCAACHGAQGEGIRSPSGQWVTPALWGAQSFNIGAGMARTYTAAAFVKRNMPIALHDRFPLGQGGLSDQEAVDVAEFFTHQPRPDFAPKTRDWPRDKKPADARY